MDLTSSPETSEQPANRAARQYVERWRQELLTGLWAIISGNKNVYKEFKKEWKALCVEPTEEEIRLAMEAIPANMRWWEVVERIATEREAKIDCQQCGKPFANRQVKVCPNCKVVLHATCFDDSPGGYETPECDCCHERCQPR